MEDVIPSPTLSSAVLDSDDIQLTSPVTSPSSPHRRGDSYDDHKTTLRAVRDGRSDGHSAVFAEGNRQLQPAGASIHKVLKESTDSSRTAPAISQLNRASGEEDVAKPTAFEEGKNGKQVRFSVVPSPPASPTSSPFKRVRFSDLVEECSIPSKDEYDGSDAENDSSDSSHSSRNSNADEGAHMLLQDRADLEIDIHGHRSSQQLRPFPGRSAGSVQYSFTRKPGTDLEPVREEGSSYIYQRVPISTESLVQHNVAGDDRTTSSQGEDCVSPDSCSEVAVEIEDPHKSRFQRQKGLSPLSRYVSFGRNIQDYLGYLHIFFELR